MTSVPPLLPEQTLQNVIRISRRDGMTVLAISGVFALLSAFVGEIWGAAVGVVIAGAGVFEMHGAKMLIAHRINGMRWLIASQVYLLFAVLGYVIWRLYGFDDGELRRYLLSAPETREFIDQTGVTMDSLLKTTRYVYIIGYTLLAVLTVLYQGGMALYFLRRRKSVAAAVRPVTSDTRH